MSETRLNIVTGRTTIYAPSRRGRPHDLGARRRRAGPAPEYKAGCPFCPGNEAMLPAIVEETPGAAGAPWRTRVTLNKYPAVAPDPDGPPPRGLGASRIGGRHEVVIETPRHDRDLAGATPDELGAVVGAWLRRHRALQAERRWASIFLFRNHGRAAGTSLAHPHTQIIALSAVPAEVRRHEARARRFHQRAGRSVFAEMAERERAGPRIVADNGGFIAFVPFAAEVPFEIWIMPRRQQADFGAVLAGEEGALAAVLGTVLSRLRDRLGDPDYNLVVATASRANTTRPWFCWHLRILPRLATPAGFELVSGMRINPSLPERDAAVLRKDG